MPIELEAVAKAIAEASGYTYVGPVGFGAFKETFEAREKDIRHAVKVYRPGITQGRVEREIDAMLRCNHPNIAKLRRVDTINVSGSVALYTVEEFLSGGTLAKRVTDRGALTIAEAINVGDLLVGAVAHIAENQLVHRDIKLENIMLRDDQATPVIVDFGLVRSLTDSSLTKTWAPRGPGTPYFAPPEQLCNDKELIDWRADQFSLGVSLALAVLGQHPYALDGQSPSQAVDNVANRIDLPSAFEKRVVAAGLPALVKMLAPWPIGRYRTPQDLTTAWRAQRNTK
jgi:serine/threonine protein kinase